MKHYVPTIDEMRVDEKFNAKLPPEKNVYENVHRFLTEAGFERDVARSSRVQDQRFTYRRGADELSVTVAYAGQSVSLRIDGKDVRLDDPDEVQEKLQALKSVIPGTAGRQQSRKTEDK